MEFIFTSFALTFSCVLRAESPERRVLVGVLFRPLPGSLRPNKEPGEGTLQNTGASGDMRLATYHVNVTYNLSYPHFTDVKTEEWRKQNKKLG